MMLRIALVAAALGMITPAAAQQQSSPSTDPLTGAILDQSALAAETAVPSVVTMGVSSQTLTATNRGNSVEGDVVETGEITIAPDAFSGFSGIGNFIMNTGNNNNVQGAVSVVVVMAPPP
jgi:hypothetical protein